MPRYQQSHDGDWIRPKMRGYRMLCCDCSLVHQINFRIVKSGRGYRVEFQPFRHKRATAAARRKTKKA